ncbi:hypothetical protein PFNF54_04174 [Plasmodium falciparum NF54]|uniref:Uncharacterized protein n=1 Tax=Plasmodium falciparum (isolate NF54) TaxID=5843 RepID=W7K0Z8_PLAFO|nr:hypothetical protein PFNF54_04174 [Plasmodium falciparum NF54]
MICFVQKYTKVAVQSNLLRYSLNNFTTVKLYKPSKFEGIKKKLFLKKRLFNIIHKKRANDIKGEPFYDNITQYTQNKRKIYMNNKYNVKETKYKDIEEENTQVKQNEHETKYKDIEEENTQVKQNEHVYINKNVSHNIHTNDHKTNDKSVQEKKKEHITIEEILFKTTTFGYIELQYILSTFIYYEKENITTHDLLTLYNFVNLSEKDIYDYLSSKEIIPEQFVRTRIITNLLKFINVNHPSLK